MINLQEILSAVSPAKAQDVATRIGRLGLDLSQVEERFIKGGGKGGQKVNKTANAVILRYEPLGLVVRAHRERQRSVNRFLALRELVDEAEMRTMPGLSRRGREAARIRKQKDRKRRRRLKETLPVPLGAPEHPHADADKNHGGHPFEDGFRNRPGQRFPHHNADGR